MEFLMPTAIQHASPSGSSGTDQEAFWKMTVEVPPGDHPPPNISARTALRRSPTSAKEKLPSNGKQRKALGGRIASVDFEKDDSSWERVR